MPERCWPEHEIALTGGRWMRDTWGVVVWVPNDVDAAVDAA